MTGVYDTGFSNHQCGKGVDPNIQWNNCVLTWVDSSGQAQSANFAEILAKAADGLAWNPNNCTLQYTDVNGNTHSSMQIGDAILSKIQFDLSAGLQDCVLTLATATQSQTVDLAPLLQQLSIVYNANQHSIQPAVKGVPFGAAQFLNCGQLDFDLAQCKLSYTNEKGQVANYFLPREQFIYNPSACQLTIIPSKPGEPSITFPVGVTEQEVGLVMTDNKTLEFTYKNKKCQVPLPNSLVACAWDPLTCVLQLTHCDDTTKTIAMPTASLTQNTLPDGTQVLVFDNGKPGGQTIFNIPAINLDTDNITVAGSVITFSGGGDGNDQTVTWDICDIVADNCNATFGSINPDGSWTFVDNAGNTFAYPAPKNCCSYHGTSPTVIDPANPPSQPSNPYPNKAGGDTVVECHPNGLAYYTCVGGQWRFDFIKLAEREVFIGPTAPAKSEGFKAWFDPTQCIVRFCDDAGNWLESRTVVCQAETPECGKGLPQIWFNPADGCLSVCCDGVWISSDAAAVRSVINAICIKVGTADPVPVPVIDGKVVIPIPDPADYCVVVGDREPIFPSFTAVDNKFAFLLPEYPEADFIETCIRLGGADGDVIAPHFEDGKNYLDLPDYPVIPETPDVPNYAVTIAGQVVNPTVAPDGTITWDLPPDCCAYSLASSVPLEAGTAPAIQNPPANKVVGSLALQKHPNGFSVFLCTTTGWLNTWSCIFPTVPNYVVAIDGEPVEPTVAEDGTIMWSLPAYPEVPEYCLTNEAGDIISTAEELADGKLALVVPDFPDIPTVPDVALRDKNGTPVQGIYDAETNTIVLDLPPVLNCEPDQPATDGSEGCIWFDGGCLNVLCEGTWISANATVTQG